MHRKRTSLKSFPSVVSHMVSSTTRQGWWWRWWWWRGKHQHPPWGSGADGVEAWRRGFERQGERDRVPPTVFTWMNIGNQIHISLFQCEAVNQTSAYWWVMCCETGLFASLYCLSLSLGIFVWLWEWNFPPFSYPVSDQAQHYWSFMVHISELC